MSPQKAREPLARQPDKRKLMQKLIASTMIILLSGFFAAQPTLAKQSRKKVIIMTLNAITLEDLNNTSTPNIDMLAEQGAVGLMNVRAIKTKQVGSFYLSIGAGARAEASPLASEGLNADEPTDVKSYGGKLTAKDLYQQNNSVALADDAVYNPGAMDSSARNFKYRNNIVPGLLGEVIKKHGIKTAVVGNADTLNKRHREITLITMDLNGMVAKGNVSSELNIEDKSFPGGLRTNYDKLLSESLALLGQADFLAIELGDTARLDSQRALMSDEINAEKRATAIRGADRFVRNLVREVDTENTLIILASPKPQKDAMLERDYLAPLVISGLGKNALISNTTRRTAIVANLDLAPTIANYLGAAPATEMTGNKIRAIEIDNPSSYVDNKHSHAVAMRTARTPFVVTYSLLLLSGLILAILAFRRKDSYLGRKSTWIKTLLLFLMAVPISSMLQIPLTQKNTAVAMASLFLIALAIALITAWFFREKPLASLFLIAGATTVLIIADSLTGTILSQRSFFGSDLIAGGRYYGLGNVYMGILIGAATFSTASAIELGSKGNNKNKLLLGVGFLIMVAIVIGHSQAGANIGGLLTAAVTALVFGHILASRETNLKNLGLNLIVLALIAVFAMGLGFSNSGTQSHAGKALTIISDKGTVAINDIIARKMKQNVRGIMSFPGFLLAAMFLMAYRVNTLLKKEGGIFKRLEKKLPALNRSFKVLIWAAIIGLAVNDTGAITAVTIMTYFLIPFLYLLLVKPDRSPQKA